MTEINLTRVIDTKKPLYPSSEFSLSPPSGRMFRIAHISDTHIGRSERYTLDTTSGNKSWTKDHIPSVRNLRSAFTILTALDPDLIVHTGDIIQEDPLREEEITDIEESLPDASTDMRLFYIRGNHDNDKTDRILERILPEVETVSLEEHGWITEANGQISIFGADYRKPPFDPPADFIPEEPAPTTITIGAFHQKVNNPNQTQEFAVGDFVPTNASLADWYDITLLGHMHTNHLSLKHPVVIDGGSTGGMTYRSRAFIGLLTFSSIGAHYQRFLVD